MTAAVRKLAPAVCALVLATGVTGCTSARNSLGTHASPCFRVLPTAIHAVGGHGAYRGVRYEPANALLVDIRRQRQMRPTHPVPPSLLAAAKSPTCLVEYHDNYTLAALQDGWSPSGATQGSYAVVVVRQRDSSLVATILLRREPERFARTYPA